MVSIPELLESAAAACRSGQVGPAEQAYRQVLERDPGHAEALGQLGLLAHSGGRAALAVEYLRRAAEAQPADATRRNTLGVVLFGQGRAAEAEVEYREALRLRPEYPEAHNNLGVALRAQGRLAEAEAAYREAVRLRPEYPEAHNNLGVALLGQGRAAEAEAAYRQALSLRPGYPEAHNNLGVALLGQGRAAEAEAACREALRLRPGYATAHSNLGNVWRDQGRPAEAEAEYRQALRLQPGHAEARSNLGNALRDQGRLAEAEAALRAALQMRPDSADAHHSLGNLLLSQGRFAEGWAEYEWRLRVSYPAPRAFGRPAWDGSPLDGRTLLLWTEQGVGDTLQFVRYAALVKERAGAVVLECPPALAPLLSRCAGIDQVVGRSATLPEFDVHAPLLSLPHRLGTTLASVPAAAPYLSADPDLVQRWREELAPLQGFTIGVAWQGNPRMVPYDRRRSFPLAALEPLARLSGVRLVVLQKGYGREQLPAAAGWPLADLGERLDEGAGAFTDTAAVLHILDLVVTCDSALAHLAGALGKACWVALPHVADWRWLRDREDSPWYPTLRLFRQARPGDWAEVFGRMADALRERRAGPTPGPVEQAVGYLRLSAQARPEDAEVRNNRGVAHARQGQAREAEAEYREALRLWPDYAEAYYNLGVALYDQGRPAEAEAAYREALRRQPDAAQAHNNLGNALRAQGRLPEAEVAYREALRRQPDSAEVLTNLGVALDEQGRSAEAEAAYREALRLRPDFAQAHNNLGVLLLRRGRFAEGWVEYEWRWHTRGLTPRQFGRPAWDGAPLRGGALLLYTEQGLGDTLQFVRYAALARQRVGRVVLECPPALIPLLSRCPGIDRLIGQGALLPAFDAHAALASLPRVLGTTADTIPAPVPYLSADPKLVRRWRSKLAALKGLKVGIAWQGNPNHPEDRRRSFPLAALAALARLPGVHLVVLQKGHGREQLPAAADWPLTDLGERLDESGGAFTDTAAVLHILDLVVTCDSALAHLAGVLGKACWVALPHAADWRWQHDREDSPWYPSLRLFRQPRPGDWAGVFGRMADALRERLN